MEVLSGNKTNMTLCQITRHFRALASKAFYAHFIIYLMTLNVDYMDPNMKKYQKTQTQHNKRLHIWLCFYMPQTVSLNYNLFK